MSTQSLLNHDPGTLTLNEVKQILYNDHSQPKKVTLPPWENPRTPEEIAKKAHEITSSRTRVNNIFHVVPIIARNIFGAIFLQKIITKLFIKLNIPKSNIISTLVVMCFMAYKFGVKQTNPDKFTLKKITHVPIIGGLPILTQNLPRLHNFLLECLREHNFESGFIDIPLGSIALLMDVRDREYVLRTHPLNFLKNVPDDIGVFEFVFGELLGRGIFAVDGKEWLDARKVASHLFSGQSLQEMTESTFNEHGERLAELIAERCETNEVFDLQELFQCVVFDAFCSLAFGKDLATTESWIRDKKKPSFLVAFDECQVHASKRVATLPIQWHIERMISHITGLGEGARFAQNIKILDDYIYPIITERKNDPNLVNNKDLLSLYINHANKTGQSHILEDVNLRDIVVNFMIAGRDTTSCTLTNIFRYVSDGRQLVKLRAMEEMKDIHIMKWDHIKELPYCNAIINEALRLAPPVGDDFHISTENCTLPSGLQIQKGTRVFIPNVAIGRDPKLWSKPDEFIPERWLKYSTGIENTGTSSNSNVDDDKNLNIKKLLPVKRVDEFVHPVFYSGVRLCLGKDMARYESLVMMSKLFGKFDFTLVENNPFCEEYVMGPVIFYKHGLKVVATKRR
jgi:cytochrome P450